ncbi:MAG: CHASE2 domain-containing protein [candidate division KSB1 bacterium]|nr:CHASE2 domain-containing protein [candidate division KSB1 bacterium]
MDGRTRSLPQGVIGLFIFLFSLTAAFKTADWSFFEFLHLKSVNAFFRVRGALAEADSSIALVLIDDRTLQQLPHPWPFPGSYYARIVRNLTRAEAKLIIFDLEFIETNAARPEEDFEFAEAIHESQRTILAGKIVYEMSKRGRPKGYLLRPNPWLEEVAAGWGLMNRVEDSDGFVRRYPLFEQVDGRVYYPLAVSAVQLLEKPIIPEEANRRGGEFILGKYRIPKASENTMLINFAGPPGKSYPTFSFLQLLDDSSLFRPTDDFATFEEILQHKKLAGKIVFVGASASLIGQNRRVPLVGDPEGYYEMSDAEVHAHALSTIRRETFIKPADPFMQAVISIAFVLAVLWFSFGQKPAAGLTAIVLLFILMQVLALFIFIRKGLLLNLTQPTIGAVFAYLSIVIYKWRKRRSERLQIQTLYSRRISPEVVERLRRYGQFTEKGLQSSPTTLLCGKIVFDSAEFASNEPAIRNEIEDFFKSAARLTLRREGSLEYVFGSNFVSAFGIPLKAADHADRGFAAMTEILQSCLKRYEKIQDAWRPKVILALHSGEMMLADLESSDMPDYRLVGNGADVVVNLASANLLYGTSVLISESVLAEMHAKPVVREIDWVRYDSQLFRLYELITEDESTDRAELLVDEFAEGLALYRSRSWAEALKIFQRILRRYPDDGPSRLYLVRCLDCLEHPPADDWEGIFCLNEKRPLVRTAVKK